MYGATKPSSIRRNPAQFESFHATMNNTTAAINASSVSETEQETNTNSININFNMITYFALPVCELLSTVFTATVRKAALKAANPDHVVFSLVFHSLKVAVVGNATWLAVHVINLLSWQEPNMIWGFSAAFSSLYIIKFHTMAWCFITYLRHRMVTKPEEWESTDLVKMRKKAILSVHVGTVVLITVLAGSLIATGWENGLFEDGLDLDGTLFSVKEPAYYSIGFTVFFYVSFNILETIFPVTIYIKMILANKKSNAVQPLELRVVGPDNQVQEAGVVAEAENKRQSAMKAALKGLVTTLVTKALEWLLPSVFVVFVVKVANSQFQPDVMKEIRGVFLWVLYLIKTLIIFAPFTNFKVLYPSRIAKFMPCKREDEEESSEN